MTRSRSVLRIAVGGALAGTLGLFQGASGQVRDDPAGLRLVVDYSLGVDVDTNEQLDDPSPGTYSALINDFDFALLSNTRNQTLALNFGTQFLIRSDPDEPDVHFDFEEPRSNLEYTRESANSRLGVSASLRQRDVDTIEPFFLDLDGDTIIDQVGFDESEGTLTEAEALVTLETGRNSPLGTTYTAAYQSRTYSDVGPDLYDRVSYRFATSTRLEFTDVTTGFVDLSYRNYEYSQGRDLIGEDASFSFGVFHEFSEILRFNGSLGYSKIREEETTGGVTSISVDQGPNANLRMERDLSNGAVFASYRRSLVEDVFRNTLTFGRDIELSNYSLRAEAGLTNLDGGDPAATFRVFYSRGLPDAQFTVSLRRQVTVDTEDQEKTLTSAIVGYDYEINDLSSFSVGLDYALVSNPEDENTEDDETRATFSATYRHALTRDWDLSVGYRARTQTTDTEDAVSNAVFVNVGRRFILRP